MIFTGVALAACTNDATLDKAIANGDVAKMQYMCEGRHNGFQKPPPEELKDRACEAREEYERARAKKLSCDELAAVYEKEAHNRSDKTRAVYYERFAECGNWTAFWSGNWDTKYILPVQIHEVKSPRGEAALRALFPKADPELLHRIIAHLAAIDEASGPSFADEVAAINDRVMAGSDIDDIVSSYRYLVKHKHPKGAALATRFLGSTNPNTRSLGCWGAGEMADKELRDTVAKLASTDSYSMSFARDDGVVLQRFVVRDECHGALAKMPPP
jgi:hypothetical protein